ncbi:MAG: NAD-dependent malic enzyme [Pseudanabaenaceae cyanobacterium SKYGB_i_bin29]|nr:NAD-dependent malic enzyme [Pseudanabaenaceae cyanobacterium SKYG29]MDW8420528.1 NAD-dependent malic enzyme [Pseudanabaenaceae cyanobacterium SKYGB_i_bin29]
MNSSYPNPSYSVSLHLRLPNRPGALATVINALGERGGNLGRIDLVKQTQTVSEREIVVNASSESHALELVEVVKSLPEVELLRWQDRTFALHEGGKIAVTPKVVVARQADLAMVYTPGVGRVSKAIADDPSAVYRYTIKGNTIAIVTDGSAVLGLGNLGAAAALPVMEGKAMLFKQFGGLDAFPICLATQDTEEIIQAVKWLAPVFGGINLEDISAPRCFEIEQRLQEELDIPVFHDDQHGTAIVVLAALTNALRLVGKSLDSVQIVINGAGAAGVAVGRLLRAAGAQYIILCDREGIISQARQNLTASKAEFAVDRSGTLADALVGADVFLGLSIGNVLTVEMVRSMNKEPIVFAMANPIPEIAPELVTNCVAVMATGRSDYPNQINNVLAFPGVLRGALDGRVKRITTEMHLAAARAIASLVSESELRADYIIPSVFDDRVAKSVASAIQKLA